MAVSLSPFAGAGWQFFDNNGVILSGGKLYVYAAGTTSSATTYTSSSGSTANTNPIILNSSGRLANEIWLTTGLNYKFILKDATDVLIGTWDNIPAGTTDVADLQAALASSTGAGMIGYLPSGVNAVATTVQNKLRTNVSNVDFGSPDTGVTDQTSYDSSAYTVASAIRGFFQSLWMFKAVNRGLKTWKRTFGTYDQAAVVSITANNTTSEPLTEVMGLTSPSAVSTYSDRDSVALYVSNVAASPLITTSNTVFTATSVTSSDFSSDIAAGNIKYGMLIDTAGSPKKTGTVTGVSGNTISVSAWYVVDGTSSTTTPTNGTEVYVNPTTKVWALNANVVLPSSSPVTQAAGFELGLVNNKVAGAGYLYDAVNLGTYKGGNAFQARGSFTKGFSAESGKDFGFTSDSNTIGYYATGGNQAFISQSATDTAFTAKNPTLFAYTVKDNSNNFLFGIDGYGIAHSTKFKYGSYSNGQTINTVDVVASCLTSTATTITMPSASTQGTRIIYLKNSASSTVSVTFSGTFESGGSISVPAGTCIMVISDGAKWVPIGKYS